MVDRLKAPQKKSVTTRYLAISPFELYLEQIAGVSSSIRASQKGLSYIPAQFGGLSGQLNALNSNVVLQMIDFENNGDQ